MGSLLYGEFLSLSVKQITVLGNINVGGTVYAQNLAASAVIQGPAGYFDNIASYGAYGPLGIGVNSYTPVTNIGYSGGGVCNILSDITVGSSSSDGKITCAKSSGILNLGTSTQAVKCIGQLQTTQDTFGSGCSFISQNSSGTTSASLNKEGTISYSYSSLPTYGTFTAGYVQYSPTLIVTSIGTSNTNILSLTLPLGTWIIFSTVSLNPGTSTYAEFSHSAGTGNSTPIQVYGTSYVGANVVGFWQGSGIIYTRGYNNSVSRNINSGSMSAIRIA